MSKISNGVAKKKETEVIEDVEVKDEAVTAIMEKDIPLLKNDEIVEGPVISIGRSAVSSLPRWFALASAMMRAFSLGTEMSPIAQEMPERVA